LRAKGVVLGEAERNSWGKWAQLNLKAIERRVSGATDSIFLFSSTGRAGECRENSNIYMMIILQTHENP
jgi:hypothetical protein